MIRFSLTIIILILGWTIWSMSTSYDALNGENASQKTQLIACHFAIFTGRGIGQ